MAAFRRLNARHQLVLLEGAGSCAEVNLKRHDLVNLPMARRAGAKVILAADIDTGGVFAQVLGTLGLMTPSERKMMAGVIINKFRGDASLFSEGMEYIGRKAGCRCWAWCPALNTSFCPKKTGWPWSGANWGGGRFGAGWGGAPEHISNYTDFDALAAAEGVELSWLERPEQLAGLDLLILPGTKNTLAALKRLRQSGLFGAIQAFHQLGGKVLGLCGGYQLLGAEIADPQGVEGLPARRRDWPVAGVHGDGRRQNHHQGAGRLWGRVALRGGGRGERL